MCIGLSAQHIRFQKTYSPETYKSGVKNKEATFYDVETLSDDGFATLGFLTDSTNNSQGFMARYDCTGKVIWTKQLGFSGSPTNTNAGIVEADNGDIVFSFNLGTGFFRASILCGRINTAGQVVWMKRIGNNTEFGRDIAKTRDGGFIVAGSTAFYGTDNTAADIYLFKLDANGNILWTKAFGNPAGTYDEAYSVKIDSRDFIIVGGRCIADGTFQAFILKADPNGNPVGFKTYGYNNQRTNSFDLIVDKNDNYLITGFTTILEIDHTSSESDPFLIKVDSALNTQFANVYEVNRGTDNSTIGEGLCQLENGDYAIGVSSLAFSTHNISGPNAPNKNALYIIQNNGNLRKAFLYNRHASQYTRVRNSSFGSVLLSGFSRAYTDKIHSQGLIIKTDNQFLTGCFDIDVSGEINVFKPVWQIADFNYQMRSGTRSVDYLSYNDTALTETVLCEEIPVLTPDFEGPDTICAGNAVFTDLSAGPGARFWLVNNDTIHQSGDLNYFFSPGTHTITRVLKFSCIVKEFSKTLVVSDAYMDTFRIVLCQGQRYTFRDSSYSASGFHQYIASGNGACDSIFTLQLSIQNSQILNESFSYCGTDTTLYGKTFDKAGDYSIVLKNRNDCDSVQINLKLSIRYSSSHEDLKEQFFCDSFVYEKLILKRPGDYKNIPVDTTADCTIKYISVNLKENCDCLEFPNVFTPENGDDLNNDFLPHNPCGDDVFDYKMVIYNRWGQKVFESTDVQSGWNGRYKGDPAPMETYLYVSDYKIRYNDTFIKSKSKKATVTLIR